MRFSFLPERGLLAAMIVLAACVTGFGCRRDSSGPQRPAARRVIGVSLLTLENPFFKVIGDAITAAGRHHGFETVVVSADKDIAKQAHQMQDFIVQGAAAIVLSPCDSRSVVPAIKEANGAGIPVFTVDIPCHEPGAEIISQVCTDNLGGGKEAAREMIAVLGATGGKLAILHLKQAESCRLRVQGFREVIDAHNADAKAAGRPRFEIVTELEAGGAKDGGAKAMEDALQAHPDIAGVFAINDPSALGARAALEKAGKADQVTIIGFDGLPEGRQAIREGRIHADPIQFPDQMGTQVVEAIVTYSQGLDVPPEILIPTSLYRRADAETDPALAVPAK
ncbi:MAG: substrate-binding domain-containing protein [Pirellulales bacterium]